MKNFILTCWVKDRKWILDRQDLTEVFMYHKRSIWIAVVTLLILIDKTDNLMAGAEQDIAIEVEIDAEKEEGPISPIFRPSVFASWADREAQIAFLRDVNNIGLVRLSVEPIMSGSSDLKDYKERLKSVGQGWNQIEQKGGKIILTLARMPRWLSSNPSTKELRPHEYLAYEASPPKNYELWSQLVYETVRHFNRDLGLDLYYELWNEPDSEGFWIGSKDDLLKLYKYFVLGAKKADPKARVGGPTVSNPGAVIGARSAGSRPFIFDFIEYASREGIPELGLLRLPIDFLVWHQFDADPHEGWTRHVNQIREFLQRLNYNQTALIVDEWTLWTTQEWEDPLRDTKYGAAYAAATLTGMEKAGIQLQAIAALQDFEAGKEGIFHGDFGLLTKGTADQIIKKPVYNVLKMFDRIEGAVKIKTSVYNPLLPPSLRMVDAIAAKHPDRITIILYNYISFPEQYFKTHLQNLGYTQEMLREMIQKKKPDISQEDMLRLLKQLLEDERVIDNMGILGKARQDIIDARRTAIKLQKLSKDPVLVQVRLKNYPAVSLSYERFVVDDTHSNSFYHYLAAKKEGKGERAAVQAAVSHQDLEKVEERIVSGADIGVSIVMEPYSVHLITLSKSP